MLFRFLFFKDKDNIQGFGILDMIEPEHQNESLQIPLGFKAILKLFTGLLLTVKPIFQKDYSGPERLV